MDLGKYRVLSIWCNCFGVNCAAAPFTKVLAKGEFHIDGMSGGLPGYS